MAILRSAILLFESCGTEYVHAITAAADYAHHTIRDAFEEQAAQEVVALLLGGLPEVRREREAQAGDDSCMVSLLLDRSLGTNDELLACSNAIRNDLVSGVWHWVHLCVNADSPCLATSK